MRFLLIPALLAATLLVTGCCSEPMAAAPGSYASGPCSVAANPCAPAGFPAPTYSVAQSNFGVAYTVGAADYAKAGLQIPANLVGCVSDFLRCSVNALFPPVTPSAKFVQTVQMVPLQAAPCQPAGTWRWEPAAPAAPAAADPCAPPAFPPAAPVAVPCPEPIASGNAIECPPGKS